MFDENIVKTGSNEMELVDFRIFKSKDTIKSMREFMG